VPLVAQTMETNLDQSKTGEAIVLVHQGGHTMRTFKRTTRVLAMTVALLGHVALANASPGPSTDGELSGGLTRVAGESVDIDFCGPCRTACLVTYGAIDPVKYKDCVDVCTLYFGSSCGKENALPDVETQS
jgi:hypothetical protein